MIRISPPSLSLNTRACLGAPPILQAGSPPPSAPGLEALRQGLGRIRSTSSSLPCPSCLLGGGYRGASQPRPRVPPPPTRRLAHAQTEAAGKGAVPEAHSGVVLAGVGASGRAQPQREVPALEAHFFQLHAGLQGQLANRQARGPASALCSGGARDPGGGLRSHWTGQKRWD